MSAMSTGPPPSSVPDRDALRASLAELDERGRKVVGGMMAVLFANPGRVREREWVTEQFTQVVLLAGEFEEGDGAQDAVGVVQAYVRDHIDPLLNACFALFLVVGDDLAARVADGVTQEDAMLQAFSYFPAP